MSVWSIPKEERADYLEGVLAPSTLMARLTAAKYPNRLFVELIGIKSSSDNRKELQDVHGPRFRSEVESDPAIRRQLDRLKALGFSLDWRGYSDPTGEEYSLVILRNPDAEAKLRSLVKGTS